MCSFTNIARVLYQYTYLSICFYFFFFFFELIVHCLIFRYEKIFCVYIDSFVNFGKIILFLSNVNELLDLLKCKNVWGKSVRLCSNFNKHWTQSKLKKMGLNYGAQKHLKCLSVTNFRHFCLSLLERKKKVFNVYQYGTFLFTNSDYFIRSVCFWQDSRKLSKIVTCVLFSLFS